MNLRNSVIVAVLATVLVGAVAFVARADAKATKVKGWVVDSACAFTKNLKKPASPECAISCAKAGSALVILDDDGHIYWPISDQMPAVGQNDRLMEFAGKRVVATGKLYERDGTRALAIDTIAADTK
ncbi:MAG: hypothetical protein WBC04_10740 [Candidatus Acidiferrales bacterium]|jgi:hypothetical protein